MNFHILYVSGFFSVQNLPPEARPLPVPGALLLVFALLGGILRALPLMIEAHAPSRSQAVHQLRQCPPLPGFDPRQRGPALVGFA